MGIWSRMFGSTRDKDRTMTHQALGEMAWNGRWWTGSRKLTSGEECEVHVGGDERELDPSILNLLPTDDAGWAARETQVREFLRRASEGDDAGLGLIESKITSFDFLWDGTPEYFVVELEWDKDPDAIWRVSFEGGVATSLSRDD